MSSDSRVGILVSMPRNVKRALVKRVRSEGANLNDVAVSILSRAYGQPFSPIGRRTAPSAAGGPVLLRVDPELKLALQLDALRNPPANLSYQVLRVLAHDLKVEIGPPGRNRSPFGGGSTSRGGRTNRRIGPTPHRRSDNRKSKANA